MGNEKMKVLFIAGWFPEGGNYNGIFIKEHALAVSRFCDVAVIYGEERKWQRERYITSFSVEDGLNVLRFTYREVPLFPSYPAYVKGVVLCFERFLSDGFRPDIIHACVYKTGIPANIIKQRYHIPYVMREGYSGFMRRSLRRSKVKKARIGIGNADYILPVSEAQKEAIMSYGISGKFEVVPNTVPDYFYYNSEVRRTSGTKRILCVAAMHPKKNIPCLIDACKIIYNSRKDFVVDIVGEGEKMGEYREMVHNYSLDDVIHFLGGKQKTEIAMLMQSSDFFVLPSKYEPSGNVLVEALACGLPVVATRVGGIPEVINETNGILVESDNPGALAEAMLYMMDNADRYNREKISLDAKNRYSYDAIGRQIISIYERVLAAKKSDDS